MRRQLLTLAIVASTVASLAAETWPHWRGPSLDGISTETNLPTTWSPTENVAWKLPLPAFSGSTPIIWNDTIFLNVATERATGQIELWAVDRNKQAVAWKRPLSGENRIGNKQNMSSPSPVTDGKHVWVITGTGVTERLRLRRQRAVDAGHPEGLRQVRHPVRLRVVAAAARRRGVSAGPARDAHRRPVLRAEDRQDDRQDGLAHRATDQRAASNRRTPTRRRRSSSTTARPRSSSPAAISSPATIRRPARSCGGRTCSTRARAATTASSRRRSSPAA